MQSLSEEPECQHRKSSLLKYVTINENSRYIARDNCQSNPIILTTRPIVTLRDYASRHIELAGGLSSLVGLTRLGPRIASTILAAAAGNTGVKELGRPLAPRPPLSSRSYT